MEGKNTNILKQKTIKLPRVLLDQIDQYLADNPQLGYLSSSEFIRECIRKKMRDECPAKK